MSDEPVEYNNSDLYKNHMDTMYHLELGYLIDRYLCFDDPSMAYEFLTKPVEIYSQYDYVPEIPTDIDDLIDRVFVIYYLLYPNSCLMIEWLVITNNNGMIYNLNMSLRDNLKRISRKNIESIYTAYYNATIKKLKELMVDNEVLEKETLE